MLRRLSLRDVVIVAELELELNAGFTVLTGETGAGKSILIDALQLALGQRADAGIVISASKCSRQGCWHITSTPTFTNSSVSAYGRKRRMA